MHNPSDITSVVWSAVNLPDGLTLGESTGIISGTPTTPGSYTTNVTVTTNWGTDTKAISIIVAVPDSWKPDIASGQVLYLTAGEEMEPYKITGTNIDITPQELVPLTTPLLDVNDENYEYVSYLPFDDYPTLDLARKIQWENHGCKLVTTASEGEHNKRLSFANGGYMIGTGEFNLYDLDGLIGMQMATDVDRDEPDDTQAAQGCFVGLYNDDCSNFIGIINSPADGNKQQLNLMFRLNSPSATYISSGGYSGVNFGPVMPWLNGFASTFSMDSKIHLFPETGRANSWIQSSVLVFGDNIGLGDYVVDLNRAADFTHISINYNPLYPSIRFSGSLGAFYLRKYGASPVASV